MICRYLNTGANDGYTNMAIDEALLKHCTQPIIRIYGWNPPAMTIGYAQSKLKEINIKKCSKKNIPIIRRITGGKAIFHQFELTYCFIVPGKMVDLPLSITDSYKKIAGALSRGLKILGMQTEMHASKDPSQSSLCYVSSGWYELLVKGKKISGSAQRRMEGKILQHGSILLDFNYNMNAELFNLRAAEHKLCFKVTNLKRELGREVSFEEAATALQQGFSKQFNLNMEEKPLSEAEDTTVKELIQNKYKCESWNKLQSIRGHQ